LTIPSNRILDWLILLGIALSSFFVFSLPYYSFLNSDIAVHVYMAESFSFSKDWYYWSQDRLGSLLPLTAFALKSVFPLSVIWSVSIAQWFYLLLGLVSFWYFIPNRWMRLLLAVLWFFPFYALVFHVLPGHPYAAQMAMLGCSFVCFHQAILKSKTSYLPLMVLFAVLAIWVSDFSAFIYLSLMLFYRTQILSQLKKTIQSKQGIIRLSSAMFVFLVGCAGLYYAKTHTFKDPNYISQLFANPEELTHHFNPMELCSSRCIF